MKCNDIVNKNVEENYRRDCAEENCPYQFTPESCRYLYTGKVRVKEMLVKMIDLVNDEFEYMTNNILEYDTETIQVLSTVSQTLTRGHKELKK